ncbi:MAG: hypothetical protein MUC87_05300 [Bacteroidia bacterium]|jgi:hypothetical protein|nr:hypothetical protein [Bacteroidia bacterium]
MNPSTSAIVLDIFKVLLPCLVVFAAAYLTVRNFLETETKRRLAEIRLANQSVVTPVRLQAYERIAIFLERINPNTLVTRVHKSGMSARLLQSELTKVIRNEFEHNLSQQIYMSNHAWEMVKTAKEEITKLVNVAASKLPDTATGVELSQMILQVSQQIDKMPTQVALEYIKKEVGQVF